MRRPCFPNRLTPARAAFAIGNAPTQRLPRPLRPPLRSSLASGLPRCAGLVRRTGASADRCNAGDISTPAPHKPALSRGETRVSQVPGPSSSCVPCSTTPPGATAPRPFSVRSLLPSCPPGTLESDSFRGYMAHGPLVRVPTEVTVGARLATGRAGSPLAGRVSHPLDDGFMKSSHTRPALPGRI